VRSGSGKRFTFRNAHPGGSGGIGRLVVTDKGGGAVQVAISGTRATLALTPADAPPQVTVVLGAIAAAGAGKCGEVTFTPAQCTTDTTKIVCR